VHGDLGADAHALKSVGYLKRHIRHPGTIGHPHVSGDTHDRAIALIDRRDRLVPDVIDIGQKRKLSGRQRWLRREKSPAARLGSEAREQSRETLAIVAAERPKSKTPPVGQK
jgi:hypothetical protein